MTLVSICEAYFLAIFIFFYMIQPFYSVMSQWTAILKLAFVSLRVFTQFRRVVCVLSSLIFDRVVIPTMLMIMLVLYRTGIYFEFIKVKMLYHFLARLSVVNHFKDLIASKIRLWSRFFPLRSIAKSTHLLHFKLTCGKCRMCYITNVVGYRSINVRRRTVVGLRFWVKGS